MYFIAHRGNTTGPQPTFENKIDYLRHAYYELGHGVECDVYTHKNKLYLGHDEPDTPVTTEIAEFIKQRKVFVHSKDVESLPALITMGCNVFFHKTDDVVFTSHGNIWCFPGVYVNDIKNAVWLDLHWEPLTRKRLTCMAVCGDDVKDYA